MRVTCRSLEDFIKNLESEDVHRNIVYYDRTSVAISDHARDVHYSAHAVQVFDGGQALLEFGLECGRDLESDGGIYAGTEIQDEIHQALSKHCQKTGLTMLPGRIDMG